MILFPVTQLTKPLRLTFLEAPLGALSVALPWEIHAPPNVAALNTSKLKVPADPGVYVILQGAGGPDAVNVPVSELPEFTGNEKPVV